VPESPSQTSSAPRSRPDGLTSLKGATFGRFGLTIGTQVATGNITAAVPDSALYHVVTSVQTGTRSDSIPDLPTSQRTISLSVGVGDVSLSH